MTPQSRTLHPTTAAARIAPLLLQLAALAIAAGGLWLWRHRRQIGAALVTAAATTYAAGAWGRQQIEALAADSARRLPSQPVAAVAPITATIAAAWGLVDRGTSGPRIDWLQPASDEMEKLKQFQETLLTDIASAYGLKPDDLLRPIRRRYSAASFAIEPIEPGEELLSPIRYRSSSAASAIEPWQLQAVVRVNGTRGLSPSDALQCREWAHRHGWTLVE
jgi:hypothetical protein